MSVFKLKSCYCNCLKQCYSTSTFAQVFLKNEMWTFSPFITARELLLFQYSYRPLSCKVKAVALCGSATCCRVSSNPDFTHVVWETEERTRLREECRSLGRCVCVKRVVEQQQKVNEGVKVKDRKKFAKERECVRL